MSIQTRLENSHRTLGAVFGRFGDWEVPVHYGNANQEALRVRKTGGIIDRSFLGKLDIEGEDRIEFLQGMVTNHVKQVTPERGMHSLIVTNKGKIVADFSLYQMGEGFMIIFEPDLLSTIQTLLDRYIIASQVELKDVSERYGMVSVHGPSSSKLIKKTLGGSIGDKEPYSVDHLNWKSRAIWAVHRRELGVHGFDLITEIDGLEPVWGELIKEGKNFEIFPFGSMAYETLRIEAGTPRYGFELNETVFPLEAGVEDAVHYDKGCYVGQETITRMKFRGHPNRGRVGFEILGDMLPKSKSFIFHDGKKVGLVTSATFSPTLQKNIGMGYVRVECSPIGTRLVIQSEDSEMEGMVCPLPFVGDRRT